MKNILYFFVCFLIISLDVSAQGTHIKRTCKSKIPTTAWEHDFGGKVSNFKATQNNPANRINASYTLPVVVHVIYWTATQNISQAQVNSQIKILNDDYAGTGLNASTCPTAFKPLLSNTDISFCMAQIAPNGATLAQPGIDRISAQAKSFTNPGTAGWIDTYIDAIVKPATIWDPTKYMNIWVLPLEDGTLGYSTFPRMSTLPGLDFGGDAQTDGVVIGYLYFGNTGTVSAPYDKGRTTTHEVGHWLGLRHISGDEECGEDYCDDTPTQTGNAGDGSGLNYDCPVYPFQVNGCGLGSSPHGELFMDFMDYTDDACMFMFTNDQRTRMQTAMLNGTYRFPLTTSNVCNVVTITATASFTSSDTVACPGGSLTFTNASTATTGSPDSVRWIIPGGVPATSTSMTTVSPTFATAGTYTISLIAYKSGTGSVAYTKTIRVKAKPTVTVNSPSICYGSTASLTANGASTYSWSNSLGTTATVTTPVLTANTTYTVTGTTASCTNSATASITIKTKPIVTVNSPSICSGTSASLTASGATTYSWNNSLGSSASATTPLLTTTSTYTVTGTANGCTASATATVTVKPKPSVTVNSPSICSGQTASLTANGATTYSWSNSLGTATTVITPILTANTNYTVTGTTNGCTGSATATVSVNTTAPTVVILQGAAINSCFGDAVTLTANGANNYVWDQPGALGNTLTFTPTGNVTVNVSGTLTGCTNTGHASTTITIKQKPTVTSNSPSICSGQAATLTATGATTYSWNNSLGSTATVSSPVLTSSTNYIVTGTSNGCTNTATAAVTVKPLPATPALTQTHDTIRSSVSGSQYNWYLNGSLLFTGNQPYYKISQNGSYKVEVVSNGCTSASSAALNIVLTGIKNNKFDIRYSVFPNPNNGSFEIRFISEKNYVLQLNMFNITGQSIYSEEMNAKAGENSKLISVPNLAKGMYLLSIITEDGAGTQNIIVQ